MFKKIIVSAVNHGGAFVYAYSKITSIKSDDEYVHISNGTYTWQFKITTIVSIVII